jgi:hypothetical protein
MGQGSAMCDFCGYQIETILHVMKDCPLVMPLWLNMVNSNMRRFLYGLSPSVELEKQRETWC